MNSIIILGSTGSIGTQALDVIDKLNIKVSVLTARKNITLLEKQIRKYKPEIAVVTQEKYALQLRENIKDTNCKVICGKDSLCQAASYENGDMILNALVGIAGLLPTMAAINAGKAIALANKETLATAGKLVRKRLKIKIFLYCLWTVNIRYISMFAGSTGKFPKKNIINCIRRPIFR